MARHKIRPTSPDDAMRRARGMVFRRPVDAGVLATPLRYALGEGGADPDAGHPGSPDEDHGGRLAADCAGFVAWALGYDRFQPGDAFPVFGGWINTDSMITEARGPSRWFEVIDRPEPAAVVVYPGVRRNGERVRIGHVGLVTAVPPAWDSTDEASWRGTTVVHCNGSTCRDHGYAVAETGARLWFGADRRGEAKGSLFLRYRRFA
jgi:hypothetical protein